MKNYSLFSGLFAAVLFTGCAVASQPLVLAPVGPDAAPHATAAATGTLVVFSGIEVLANSDPTNDVRRHTSYEIWSADGAQRLQTIRNYELPNVDEGPMRVSLPPGSYLVKAMANTYGSVHVPVVIAAHRTTTLHLDNDPRKPAAAAQPNLVQLPDGTVVGSRASS